MSPAPRLPASALRVVLRGIAPLVFSPAVPVDAQRRRSDLASALVRPPRGTRVEPTALGGVRAERLVPPGATQGAALLYLHGGGYCIGSPRSHRGLAARIAAAAGVPALVPDYRLAPEHPHPAALEDALAAYSGLLESGIAPERVIVAGDSAGGGLALALAMALRDSGRPAPAVVGMICPWLDLTVDVARSRPAAPRDPLLTPDIGAKWAAAYVSGGDPADPAISPLFGDLVGLPPLVLHYAGDDLIAGDGERLVARGRAEGVQLDEQRYDGLWHDFHAHVGLLAIADEAVAALGESLRARLAPTEEGPRSRLAGRAARL